VRNLSRKTTEAKLLPLFEEYAAVQYCKLVMDKVTGRTRGFGFAVMPRAGQARVAIRELNAREIGGNRIRVKKPQQRGDGAPPGSRRHRAHDEGQCISKPGVCMSDSQPDNALHGVTLEMLPGRLVERHRWEERGGSLTSGVSRMIPASCPV
jgi:RNA recognition motif-containing protein